MMLHATANNLHFSCYIIELFTTWINNFKADFTAPENCHLVFSSCWVNSCTSWGTCHCQALFIKDINMIKSVVWAYLLSSNISTYFLAFKYLSINDGIILGHFLASTKGSKYVTWMGHFLSFFASGYQNALLH